MKYVILAILLAAAPAGCNVNQLSPNAKAPICDALVGPIRYNSRNKNSLRYAARLLVPDLKQRNQIGQRLGCPQYR